MTRRELLAIEYSIKHFHHYIYGRNVIFRSDHSSLKWLLNIKNVEGQLSRWITFFNAYDFTIEHRAGRLHSNADAYLEGLALKMVINIVVELSQKSLTLLREIIVIRLI